MSFTITSSPKCAFKLPFTRTYVIQLKHEVRQRLKLEAGEQSVTTDIALKTLKRIKIVSEIKAVITKPVIVILSGVILLGAGISIAATVPFSGMVLAAAIVLKIARTILAFAGGGLIGFGIQNSLNGLLPRLSNAYQNQADLAEYCLNQIKQRNQPIVNIEE